MTIVVIVIFLASYFYVKLNAVFLPPDAEIRRSGRVLLLLFPWRDAVLLGGAAGVRAGAEAVLARGRGRPRPVLLLAADDLGRVRPAHLAVGTVRRSAQACHGPLLFLGYCRRHVFAVVVLVVNLLDVRRIRGLAKDPQAEKPKKERALWFLFYF